MLIFNRKNKLNSIYNQANSTTIDGGGGNDTVFNDYAFYSSIEGGEGSDVISVASSSQDQRQNFQREENLRDGHQRNNDLYWE